MQSKTHFFHALIFSSVQMLFCFSKREIVQNWIIITLQKVLHALITLFWPISLSTRMWIPFLTFKKPKWSIWSNDNEIIFYHSSPKISHSTTAGMMAFYNNIPKGLIFPSLMHSTPMLDLDLHKLLYASNIIPLHYMSTSHWMGKMRVCGTV